MPTPLVPITGTLVDDPELRFTPQGKAVVNFRVAANDRKRAADGSWEDGDSVFLTVTAWEQMAENIADCLQKGMHVLVFGRLSQRSYEANDGTRRTVYEVKATDVGPSLRRDTARVTRTQRQGAQGQQAQGQRQQARPPQQEQPYIPPQDDAPPW